MFYANEKYVNALKDLNNKEEIVEADHNHLYPFDSSHVILYGLTKVHKPATD